MKHDFSFNSEAYNFWPIYDAIKKHYPLGINRLSPLYFEYAGIKELDAKVANAIHNIEAFAKWTSFENEIKQRFNMEIIGTTFGQAPSYSSDLIIESTETKTFRQVKKLSFAVSLIGDFYTIYGVDETAIKEKNQNKSHYGYHSINVVTTSPYMEYESIFKDLKNTIKAKFPGYKFVPFDINVMAIDGLQVRYLDNEECTVFNALFNHLLDSYNPIRSRGDRYFGYEEWQTENFNPNAIKIDFSPPPSGD